jgi:glutathione synthase/RimK-type ligase-like ATP-grasp enzyme
LPIALAVLSLVVLFLVVIFSGGASETLARRRRLVTHIGSRYLAQDMNRNLKALIKACDNLKISYSCHYHATENLIAVHLNHQDYLFLNWTTPLNRHSITHLCLDKDYFAAYFQDVIRLPRTRSFLNPYCDPKYARYLQFQTIAEIIKAVEGDSVYPIVIKNNRGSLGTNVFKVTKQRELEQGFIAIFNQNSASFDYVGLVQEYIAIAREYRVIYLQGEYQFAYLKDQGQAQFVGNLSPLHWQGAKACLVTDPQIIEQLQRFCAPLFKKLLIPFCGLDVAIDTQGRYWLIEANAAPGFERFIQDQGDEVVVRLYRSILQHLANIN